MAQSCPNCGVLNPYGAEICGDCGHALMIIKSASPASRNSATPSPALPSFSEASSPERQSMEETISPTGPSLAPAAPSLAESTRLLNFSLASQGKRAKAPFLLQLLSGFLYSLSLICLIMSAFIFINKHFLSWFLSSFISSLFPSFRPLLQSAPTFVNYRHGLWLLSFSLTAAMLTFIVAYGLSYLKKWAIPAYLGWVILQLALLTAIRVFAHRFDLALTMIIVFELIIALLLRKGSRRLVG